MDAVRARMLAAFDLLAWPILGSLAALVGGPALRWLRDEPLPETEADAVG